MTKNYRIAVLGLTHDHVWGNLDELKETDSGTLVAVADPHQTLREKAEQQYGCKAYADGDQLLDAESLDAVYVYGDNRSSVKWACRAAERGLPILIEKPLAADLADADRLLATVRRTGVRMMVNWPFAWWPQLQHAIQLAASGRIGDVWQVKYRAAHAGPKELGCSDYFCDWLFDPQRNGGGALIDYCCYGALLSRCLMGQPSRVSAVAQRTIKEQLTVEDNAVLIMTYARGLSLAEASWTQIGKLSSYVTFIYGTQATLMVEPRVGGRLLLASEDEPEGSAVEVPAQPRELRSGSDNFLHCLATGAPFFSLCDDRLARDTQEILQAGLQAARRGRDVSLPLR